MGKIAGYLMEGLIKNQLVKETDREIYQYGLEKLVGKIISYTALFLLAVILRMILPSLFFLGFFFALRGRTGGYHASTETGCLIGTMVIYLAVMELFLPFFMRHGEAVIACVAFSVFSVIAFVPVNHPNLGFDREELAQYKKRSRIVLSGEIAVIGALTFLGVRHEYVISSILGMSVCAFLICLAKAVKQEVREIEGQ